ncbi:MAG: ribosome maturation factor RimM [Deltaproteobacteria bacterium]|nr:ribosome maturation factor RimM [Deltaproteobacteria bacterium]
MSSVPIDNLVLLGKVVRPHGLEGLLRIQSYAESERSFLNAETIYLKPVSGSPQKAQIRSLRPHKKVYLMAIGGIGSIEAAEALRGAEIWVPEDALIREEGMYFWYELLGLEVYLKSGEWLGNVSQIIETKSHDIYKITAADKEIFVPATHEVVEEIDLDQKTMIISPMEGLLDLNEGT